MGEGQHHYTGLTDAEVVVSRERFGTNVLTPPKENSAWENLKDCLHFWLLKAILLMLGASIVVVIAIGLAGVTLPDNIWVGNVILLVLVVFTWLVAYLGGKWDEDSDAGAGVGTDKGKYVMDPLITILLAALVLSGAISFYQGVFGGEQGFTPYFEPVGIAFAVLLATGVAHILEAKNEKTFKALNEVNDETLVKVIRNNNICQVERKEIVVGDIVLLNTGEEVPADCILLEAEHLSVNESSLNGESTASHKTTVEADFDKEATYPSNIILKGTTILVGNCIARVEKVGDSTECGKVFVAAQVREGDETPLSRKLNGLAELITKASYIIAGLIVFGRILVYFIQGNADFSDAEGTVSFIKYVLDTIMIAVTLIVVAVPEGLPMAVTLSLAFSMRRLMEQNTLPRTMHSCETMGATSVICTDKTGTLTQNQMQVHETFFPELKGCGMDDSLFAKQVVESMSVNTTANLDYSDKDRIKAIGSPTEGALLLWLHGKGVNYLDIRETTEKLDRIPFSTEIKYMATIVRSKVTGKRTIYVTGAPDILMSLCKVDSSNVYGEKLTLWQSQAYRTLGMAYGELSDDDNVIMDGTLMDRSKLKMMGVVAISDPIRPEVPAAIKECLNAGIQVKIVTGDTVGTAKEIGRQVGLWNEKDSDNNILTGTEVAAMNDDELKRRLPDVKIISRARPNDKERVVRTLKAMDEVVAVTGDGTNDAPALNAAHVGLSMGDGTAVAKEASDMTILDNSFSTIANAVMWGRSLYKNIKRFILFQMTVNVTACFIVLVGAFIGTESPLTVTQMLWVNLIMDTFAALALASLPPSHTVMKERPRSMDEHILKGIGKPILEVGLSFAFICLAILLYFQHHDVTSLTGMIPLTWGGYDGVSAHELGLFFTFFVMLHFWYMFNAKAHFTKGSAFKGLSWKNTRWFIIITVVIFFVQIALVEVPGLQEMFNVAPGGLGLMNWIIILVTTSLVVWLGELTRPIKKD